MNGNRAGSQLQYPGKIFMLQRFVVEGRIDVPKIERTSQSQLLRSRCINARVFSSRLHSMMLYKLQRLFVSVHPGFGPLVVDRVLVAARALPLR